VRYQIDSGRPGGATVRLRQASSAPSITDVFAAPYQKTGWWISEATTRHPPLILIYLLAVAGVLERMANTGIDFISLGIGPWIWPMALPACRNDLGGAGQMWIRGCCWHPRSDSGARVVDTVLQGQGPAPQSSNLGPQAHPAGTPEENARRVLLSRQNGE